MLTEERFVEILKIVDQEKSVTVQELTKLLNTSESTIRRDLTALHKSKKLIKVHGGATAVNLSFSSKDEEVAARHDMNIEDKKKIGGYAAGLIEDGDFVYLDAGTTTDYLIDYITAKDVVFVTDGITLAQKLAGLGFRVILPGGEVKKVTDAVIGATTVSDLTRYIFTKGFFGTNGFDLEHGFTTPDVNEAKVKEQAMKQCKQCFVLADPSKIGQISLVKFAEKDAATIITTEIKDSKYRKNRNIIEIEKL